MLKPLWFLFVFVSITLACDPVYHQCCWNFRCDRVICTGAPKFQCHCDGVGLDGCKNQHHGQSEGCNKGTLLAQRCSGDLAKNCVSTNDPNR
ncbi:hypothetical protein Vi05172_g5749 [Venturia inaequalis]|nr:hypothetical protein Vi05172_g5749 [Venturia inaequalis]